MELVRNVFFNTDQLIRDETVKISYTGELKQIDKNLVVEKFLLKL